MNLLTSQLESVLLFKNEPVSVRELASLLGAKASEVKAALTDLQESYQGRGIVLVSDGEQYSFGTSPENSALIEKIQKEEFSRDLGRAGLETLAVVLYRGTPENPVSRREIDRIRGVNSGFILRNLLIRGLIERTESVAGERSFSYKPTLALYEHLGISRREDLPEFKSAWQSVEEFVKAEEKEEDEHANA